METNKILQSDILDLLFDGKNKEYGAYQLRKTYNNRLGRALLATAAIVLSLFCFGFVSGHGHPKPVYVDTTSVVITAIADPTPPTPPPPVHVQPQVAMVRDVTVRIVPDKDVTKDVTPPENADLDQAKIGTVNMTGPADAGDVVPTTNDAVGKGIVAAPKNDDDNDGKPFYKVEIESQYPGGPAAWLRFLNKNLQFPQDAIDKELSGTVMVRFIVDKDGTISDVEAVSGPDDGGVKAEVIRVIKKSGKWTPAVQNGRYVKSYKQQPVTFHLEAQ